MKLNKLLLVTVLTLIMMFAIPKNVKADYFQSPTGNNAPEIVTETVVIDGVQVETTGYIAVTNASGEVEILKAVTGNAVTLSTDIQNNEQLKKIKEDIEKMPSLKALNSDLDRVAQSIDPKYDSQVFVITDLFDITLSDELKAFLASDPNYYYNVTIDVKTVTQDSVKPVIMHLSETTNEWLIVDDSLVEVNEKGVNIKFNELCPIMVLTVNEDNLVTRVNNIPWIPLIVCSSIAGLAIIYMVVVLTKKKEKPKK